MADFYPEEYIRVGRAPERVLQWLRRRDLEPRVRLVADQPGRRVLDVGCATGEFLALLQQRGWSVAGIDCDGGKPPVGQWAHLVCTFDGQTARVYQRVVRERAMTAW